MTLWFYIFFFVVGPLVFRLWLWAVVVLVCICTSFVAALIAAYTHSSDGVEKSAPRRATWLQRDG